MATLILDTVEDTALDSGSTSSAKVRGGTVIGLTGDPSQALEQILDIPEMPKLGSTTVIGGRTVFLENIRCRATLADSARVLLVYSNDFSGQGQAYILSFRGYQQSYVTNRLPGTKKALNVPIWRDPNNKFNKVPQDLAFGTFSYSMREIEISGMKQGAAPPPGTYDGVVNYANDADFFDRPPGYWVITRGSQDFSKYAGFWKYSLAAVTKNIEDWSEWFTLFNRKSGLYVTIPPNEEDQCRQKPYSYGEIYAFRGLLRIGPFPTTDFNALFGFQKPKWGFSST